MLIENPGAPTAAPAGCYTAADPTAAVSQPSP